ncbi:hypothetical protein [Helicobacter cetorum]|uniref:Uncharacterized protein n=1 Tax=Helicobacter cetorum (strain ATCC BAA-540 / CCUG 52418 / MIT 99-5656) TaxID=1163745 RepID=I0EQE6_HELCM|nr:hypothetical protein [Helicobacter cetorum]AFI05165.1 hypothetical protein HCD_00665 [Helicobacter cetorum MIT 99-5656]
MNSMFKNAQNQNIAKQDEYNAFGETSRYDDIDNKKRLQELEKINQEMKWNEEINKQRKYWTKFIFGVIFTYIIVIILIFCAIGFGWLKYNDSSVVNIFLGTTSVHVIGLAYIVAKWLFPHLKDSKPYDAQ